MTGPLAWLIDTHVVENAKKSSNRLEYMAF